MTAVAGPTNKNFSIEGVIIGRNDDYEPNWVGRLYAALTYNFALTASYGLDYRVAFVEWNPPAGKPLLAPALVQRFPSLRALVIDAEIHAALCQEPGLSVMLNFAFNPGFRTSQADFLMTATGDVFWGRELVERIARDGLSPGTVYRAERANIRNDLDFAAITGDIIEDPANLVGIDAVTEPPYTNACGDFILMDRANMLGLRGLDESVKTARLGLDSRLCLQAVATGLDAKLLGRIYHIDHHNSYRNRPSDYPGQQWDCTRDLPYLNQQDWALASFDWQEESDRLVRISLPRGRGHRLPAISDPDVRTVTERVIRTKARTVPTQPPGGATEILRHIPTAGFRTPAGWQGTTEPAGSAVVVRTAREPWTYSSVMPLEASPPACDQWIWAAIELSVERGTVGVSLFHDGEISHEQAVWAGEGNKIVYLPLDRAGQRIGILVRNYANEGESTAEIGAARLIAQKPLDYAELL